jgi:hypothetical protein
MPVLPIIDLLIFLGWTTLAAGGILKAIYLATSYCPTLFSLTPIDLVVVAMAFLGLSLALAARTWVRLNEPQLLASRRAAASLQAAAHHETLGAANAPGPRQPTAPVVNDGGDPDSPRWQRLR